VHLNFIQKKKKRKQVHLKNFLKTAEEWLASPFYQARCAQRLWNGWLAAAKGSVTDGGLELR